MHVRPLETVHNINCLIVSSLYFVYICHNLRHWCSLVCKTFYLDFCIKGVTTSVFAVLLNSINETKIMNLSGVLLLVSFICNDH